MTTYAQRMRRAALLVLGLLASLVALVPTGPAQADTYLDLVVSPSHDQTHVDLVVSSYEESDALPDYSLALKEVATGATVPLGDGYAPESDYSDREGPYTQPTAGALTVGVEYEAFFHYTTVGYTSCSIYYSDGCHWIKGAVTSGRWRFRYTGQPIDAAPYDAPTKITAVRTKAGAHGWVAKFKVTSAGSGLSGKVLGEYRTRGGWHPDNSFKTDRRGKGKATFDGEKVPTSYRFVFESESFATSHSKPFSITRR